MADAPYVIMLAGPNGAGKTTTATTLFYEQLRSVDFVNADIIAQGLSGSHPDSVALQAGAIMLDRLHALADRRQKFAFETTGASRSFAPWLQKQKRQGHLVFIYFFWLADAGMAVARVAERVSRGGHHVPEETIRRRYDGGLRNFFRLYRPLATTWELTNNSSRTPLRIARGGEGLEPTIENDMLWNELVARYGP